MRLPALHIIGLGLGDNSILNIAILATEHMPTMPKTVTSALKLKLSVTPH